MHESWYKPAFGYRHGFEYDLPSVGKGGPKAKGKGKAKLRALGGDQLSMSTTTTPTTADTIHTVLTHDTSVFFWAQFVQTVHEPLCVVGLGFAIWGRKLVWDCVWPARNPAGRRAGGAAVLVLAFAMRNLSAFLFSRGILEHGQMKLVRTVVFLALLVGFVVLVGWRVGEQETPDRSVLDTPVPDTSGVSSAGEEEEGICVGALGCVPTSSVADLSTTGASYDPPSGSSPADHRSVVEDVDTHKTADGVEDSPDATVDPVGGKTSSVVKTSSRTSSSSSVIGRQISPSRHLPTTDAEGPDENGRATPSPDKNPSNPPVAAVPSTASEGAANALVAALGSLLATVPVGDAPSTDEQTEEQLTAKNVRSSLRGWCRTVAAFGLVMLFHYNFRLSWNIAIKNEDDFKILVALLIWPALRELCVKLTRSGVRDLCVADETRPMQAWLIPFLLSVGLIGRFLICSMRSLNSVVFVTVVGSLQEIVMRQTFDMRDRWVARRIKRWTPVQIRLYFDSVASRKFRARLLLSEMYAEYAAILLAPLAKWIFADVSLVVNLGYTSFSDAQNSRDALFLLKATLCQVFAEILVDILCCGVEQRSEIPIVEMWCEMGLTGSPLCGTAEFSSGDDRRLARLRDEVAAGAQEPTTSSGSSLAGELRSDAKERPPPQRQISRPHAHQELGTTRVLRALQSTLLVLLSCSGVVVNMWLAGYALPVRKEGCRKVWQGTTEVFFVCKRGCALGLNYAVLNELCVLGNDSELGAVRGVEGGLGVNSRAGGFEFEIDGLG